jgi:4,5-dihydroxyphthalate decarboxylase
MRGETAARRLFADCQGEEQAYYQKFGDFPIMHVIAMRQTLLNKEPWLAMALMNMFNDAYDLANVYFDDPNWSRLAWGRHYYELERNNFSEDPWANGFSRNRTNIERFINYSHDQALIEAPYSPESLFAEQTLNT